VCREAKGRRGRAAKMFHNRCRKGFTISKSTSSNSATDEKSVEHSKSKRGSGSKYIGNIDTHLLLSIFLPSHPFSDSSFIITGSFLRFHIHSSSCCSRRLFDAGLGALLFFVFVHITFISFLWIVFARHSLIFPVDIDFECRGACLSEILFCERM
jgi:hypothetical protein